MLSACSKTEPAAPPGPAALALPLAEGGHGVLPVQSAQVTVKGAKGDYSQTVAMTPNWWVGAGEFKVVWFAGDSQTKRFFVLTDAKGAPADQPSFLKHPEEGVREVRVSFDGGLPMLVRPTTARALFTIPAGAKAVTGVQIAYGSADAPQTYAWK
jgi:hypothetical protein